MIDRSALYTLADASSDNGARWCGAFRLPDAARLDRASRFDQREHYRRDDLPSRYAHPNADHAAAGRRLTQARRAG
jgi:hypothetical protein